jgi:hypothetical protein
MLPVRGADTNILRDERFGKSLLGNRPCVRAQIKVNSPLTTPLRQRGDVKV